MKKSELIQIIREEIRKAVNEVDQQQITNLKKGLDDAFDGVEQMPLDNETKLKLAKTGIALTVLAGVVKKYLKVGLDNMPADKKERLKKMQISIDQAQNLQGVKQALLDAIEDFVAQSGMQ